MVDLIFWAGQVLCAAGMAYGGYLSVTFSEHVGTGQGERSNPARMHHLATA